MHPFVKKRLFTVSWICLFLVLFFYPPAKIFFLKSILHTGIFNASTKKEPHAKKEIIPINLSLVDQKGATLNTADLKGKTIFINFWASWCPPCVAEMSSINALYNKLIADPQVVFIMIDADNNFASSLSFMKKNKYDLPVYQLTSPISHKLYSGTLPTTLIIDTSENIIQQHTGIANYDTEAMLRFLRTGNNAAF